MSNLLFAAVADDDTGATDLAGMLQSRGVRTVVIFDSAEPAQLRAWTEAADAAVLGIGSRALPPEEAHRRTRDAMDLLESVAPRTLFVKYCSTFDSSAEGNIGPSIEAALEVTGEAFTLAVPALPVQGRTTYQGHHFVGRQLLSDSPMRHHPLTPMRNPDLLAHLAAQTSMKVGLAPHSSVAAGVESLLEAFARLRGEGVRIALVDCTNEADLLTIARAASEMRLLTGSSALAMVLPPVWAEQGWWIPPAGPLPPPSRSRGGRGFLVVAGSCSEATRIQVEHLGQSDCVSLPLDPVALASGAEDLETLARQVSGALAENRTCLISTASQPESTGAVLRWAQAQGMAQLEAGTRIGDTLASLTVAIVRRTRPAGLVVAGGETSGAICRALKLGALEVGANIVPGVPVCVSLGDERLSVVFKSGNFGEADFFTQAIRAIEALPMQGREETT